MPPGAIPFPFGVCRICKDKATGVHYGVTTCEGCKGFFKRSITRGDKYKCFFGGDCDLTPKNRNRCKSCRFKKCLEVGMAVEAVRMGRIPKVEKEKALQVFHKGGSDFKNLEIQVEMTGTGTYDFKINPKEDGETKILQTGSHDHSSQRLIQHEQAEIQSDNSQTVPCVFDCNLKKLENREMDVEEKLFMKDGPLTSVQMPENFTQTHLMDNQVINQADYQPNSQMKPHNISYFPDDVLCNRSLTTNSHKFVNSNKRSHLGYIPDTGQTSGQYNFFTRKQQDNINVPLNSFKTFDSRYVPSCRNFEQLQFNENTLASRPEYHQNSAYDVMQSSCSYSDFRAFTHGDISSQTLNGGTVTKTSTTDESGSVQQFKTPKQHSVNPAIDICRNFGGDGPRFHQVCNDQFQQFIQQEAPKPHTLSESSIKSSSEHCFGLTADSFSRGSDAELHYKMTSVDKNAELLPWNTNPAVPQSPFKSTDEPDLFPKSTHNLPTVNTDVRAVHRSHSELSKIDTDGNSDSIENLRCSSPGSVISREGSNSSQRSGYSSAIIQILLDQLLESDQVTTFANNLKKKLDTPQADVVERLLKLVDDASQRSCKPCNENERLNKLPENKLESLNRFLKDLNSAGTDKEAPLLKKKRCIEEIQIKESFENSDGHRPPEMFSLAQDLDKHKHSRNFVQSPLITNQSEKNYISVPSQDNLASPYGQRNLQDSFASLSTDVQSSETFCRPDNHHVYPQPENNPVPLSPSQSRNISDNRNSAYFNSQQVLTNNLVQWNDESVSASKNISSVSKTDKCVRTFTNTVQETTYKEVAFNNTLISDSVVSSTVSKETQENVDIKCEEEMLATINCMNLAIKILNRFKPEHREKIRLFKQGQLYLQILTDSDEDCAAIYEKLLQGIPGLNDRILGFCESVPGFLDICKEDREKLVKRSYYDMWTLSYAEYFQDGKSFWILPTGEIYSAEAMRKILNDEMVDTIMTFADLYNKFDLTDLETALFSAVRLTITTGLDLQDQDKVEQLHSHFLNTLAFEMRRNHHGNHMRLFLGVLKLVPLIESINKIQGEIIANFSVKRFSKKTVTTDSE